MFFDSDGKGVVDSTEFIREFFKIGKQERLKLRLAHIEDRDKINRNKARREEDRMKRFLSLKETKFPSTFSEDDENSAIKKIAKVAFTYDIFKGGLDVSHFNMMFFFVIRIIS
jgi:hypothetical protein